MSPGILDYSVCNSAVLLFVPETLAHSFERSNVDNSGIAIFDGKGPINFYIRRLLLSDILLSDLQQKLSPQLKIMLTDHCMRRSNGNKPGVGAASSFLTVRSGFLWPSLEMTKVAVMWMRITHFGTSAYSHFTSTKLCKSFTLPSSNAQRTF